MHAFEIISTFPWLGISQARPHPYLTLYPEEGSDLLFQNISDCVKGQSNYHECNAQAVGFPASEQARRTEQPMILSRAGKGVWKAN